MAKVPMLNPEKEKSMKKEQKQKQKSNPQRRRRKGKEKASFSLAGWMAAGIAASLGGAALANRMAKKKTFHSILSNSEKDDKARVVGYHATNALAAEGGAIIGGGLVWGLAHLILKGRSKSVEDGKKGAFYGGVGGSVLSGAIVIGAPAVRGDFQKSPEELKKAEEERLGAKFFAKENPKPQQQQQQQAQNQNQVEDNKGAGHYLTKKKSSGVQNYLKAKRREGVNNYLKAKPNRIANWLALKNKSLHS